MLRIESGLIFAGYEFCDQTDPFEAGISFTVPLKTKDEDFSGKESLILRKKSPLKGLSWVRIRLKRSCAPRRWSIYWEATGRNYYKRNTFTNTKKEHCLV